jgi:hypothetical protein
LSTRARLTLTVALVVLLAAGGAAAVFAYEQSRPTSVELDVKDGQRDLRVDRKLVFTASRPIMRASLGAALKITPAVEGDLAAAPGNRVFAWVPRAPWAGQTEYTVRLAAARDLSGHATDARRWRFTTALGPRVVSLIAGPGMALPDYAEVRQGAPLTLAFNTAMETASVHLLANGGPIGLTWAADARSAAIDVAPLRIGMVELAVAPGGRGRDGEPLLDWKRHAAIVFRLPIHTVPLAAPALVQVPNDPAARDQSGLQAASIVYEYLTEGQITRFTAIYTNIPDSIGPIRSGRLISLALTRRYHGTLVASGLSDGTMQRLDAEPVPRIFDFSPSLFYRTFNRPVPDNLFIAGPVVQKAVERSAPFGLAPGAVPIVAGGDGSSAMVPEHHSAYAYDTATQTYSKQVDGRALSDAETGQPLHIRLLIVLHTTATQTGYVEDVNGLPGLDFDLQSGGRAEYYFDGLHAAGRWAAPDRSGPPQFTLDGGQVVTPGPLTWVSVVTSP